jgi:hypothetical protein
MTAVSLRKQRLYIPFADVASIRLVESDLQFLAQLIFDQLMKLITCDDDVDAVRRVVFDFNGAAMGALDGLPLLL